MSNPGKYFVTVHYVLSQIMLKENLRMNRHVTVQVCSGCKHSLTLGTGNHRLLAATAAGIFSTNTATFPTHWAAFSDGMVAFPTKNVGFSDIFAAGAPGADRAATVWW